MLNTLSRIIMVISQTELNCGASSMESVDNSHVTINLTPANDDEPCKSLFLFGVKKYNHAVTVILLCILLLTALVTNVENIFLSIMNVNKMLHLSETIVNITSSALLPNKNGAIP